jgi:transcriptional regulator with PAS, ATPase and Fis domain
LLKIQPEHYEVLYYRTTLQTVTEPTQTATLDLGIARKVPEPGLIIVHHGEAQFVGSVAPVPARGALVLGREGDGFALEAMQDGRISRRHVEIRRKGRGLVLRDLESRNGTTVNGSVVSETALHTGDVIALGQVLLLVALMEPDRLRTPHPRLVGSSPALGRAIRLIEQVAMHDMPVLVLGETGVGKELLCQEIHTHSGRRGRCVIVNCATLPDDLVQSELFGHVKGAFSGADRSRRGLVVESRGGTLVLDEIGEASPHLQSNLLRLLQDREVRAVGSDRSTMVDVRFVAATNRSLADEVRAGRFREDLYARLNRSVVRMSPLRERREDILPLARHFGAAMAGQAVQLSLPLALELLRCEWPGNARSIQSMMDRILLECPTEDPLPAPDWLEVELGHLARADDPVLRTDLQSPRGRPGQGEVEAVLRRHKGHMTHTAEELGIGRNTLYRWLKKWGIKPNDVRG